jgi:hypothetical protein
MLFVYSAAGLSGVLSWFLLVRLSLQVVALGLVIVIQALAALVHV